MFIIEAFEFGLRAEFESHPAPTLADATMILHDDVYRTCSEEFGEEIIQMWFGALKGVDPHDPKAEVSIEIADPSHRSMTYVFTYYPN